MSIKIVTKVKVLSKWENESKDRDGNPKTYYNLKVGDIANCENQILSVPKEVYDLAQEEKEINLAGRAGGLKDKYFYFNEVIKG